MTALNLAGWLEGVGLPHDGGATERCGVELARVANRLLELDGASGEPYFALEHWSEGEIQTLDRGLRQATDEALVLLEYRVNGAPLSWRNWKSFQRQPPSQDVLGRVFEQFVERSRRLQPLLAERYECERESYSRLGLTKAQVFAYRERTELETIRRMLRQVGEACRAPFERRLRETGGQIFGYAPGAPELQAMNNNRMYDWLSPRLDGVDAVAETGRMFRGLGFDLTGIPLDLENRPGKYPGAFCYPIATPSDVRVSVSIASPHHLLDMLFHEFGHAVHFAGIDPSLSVLDRCWIHSGTHETFSTLFELLLGDPLFLRSHFAFDEVLINDLVTLDRLKAVWAGTYSAACGLAAIDAWMEDLTWDEYENRYAGYLKAFTGLDVPPGYTRLEGFAKSVTVYPAGYVMANIRCVHWLRELRGDFGQKWWANPKAGEAIRQYIRPGGAVEFPAEWLNPGPFLEEYAD